MAYDKDLAARIRGSIETQSGLTEREMFGGIGFMLHGNMACGVIGNDMIVRVSPEQTEQLLEKSHTKVFDFSGRPMKGWIVVEPEAIARKSDLEIWVRLGVERARSLPPK